MAKKVLREEDAAKKEKTAAFEREDEMLSPEETKKVLVDFSRFTEESAALIIGLDIKAKEEEAKVAELTARVETLTAIVSQLNTEMSKLTGDLYRTANANETFHRELANLIADLARSLPSVIDSRLSEVLVVEEVKETKPPEEKPKE